MSDRRAHVSLGVAAAIGADVAARIAPAVEAAGLHALWVNETPGQDALGVLAAAARVTDRLVLATGILPVDRRRPAEILDRIDALGLPVERLVVGVGSGAPTAGALERVQDAAAELRARTTARVVVGALGPKMRRLGAEASDGLLLSWLTPEAAARQADEARAISPGTHVALYVRTALDPAAQGRLDAETARYASYPSYAANFARLGIDAAETTLGPRVSTPGAGDGAASGPDDPGSRLERYRAAVDEVVLRAITAADDAEAYVRFVEAVATSG